MRYSIAVTETLRNGNTKTYMATPDEDTAEGCGELVWVALSEALTAPEVLAVSFRFSKKPEADEASSSKGDKPEG